MIQKKKEIYKKENNIQWCEKVSQMFQIITFKYYTTTTQVNTKCTF